MAKGKGGKRQSGADTTGANNTPVANNKAHSGDVLPQIEESAFAGLRQKIEQRLQEGNAKQKGKNNKSPAKPGDGAKNANAKDNAKSDAKATAKPADKNKGKKRDRNGEVIAREGKGGKSDKGGMDDTLRQEILALGGTEEDFDMLAGVDSEAEEESKPAKKSGSEDSLREELSSILAAAGQVVPDDLPDEEVEAEAEEDEEDDDDEEEDEAEFEDEDEVDQAEAEFVDKDSDSDEEPSKPEVKQPKAKETPETIFPKEFSKLTVLPRSDWYMTSLPSISTKATSGLPRHVVDRVHAYALTLLEKENKLYGEAQQASASSSYKFYSTIMTTGTLSDKISALTLAVQESPLHNTKSLENLVSLGKKRSRAQAVEVLRSLKDMFAQGTLLPNDRRLRAFANQPGLVAAFQGAGNKWSEGAALPGGLKESHLMVWAFEHLLKDQYFEVLKILETWCSDEIEFSRTRAVSYVFELLKEKPEQEANLLRLLVNKLGDNSKKIASRASYLLLQLEQSHPLMKPTIIKSVEEVLFRPGQSQHAKYYSIITLNQTVLSGKEEEVGVQLLDIYFSLFVVLLKPKHRKFQNDKKHGKGKKQSAKDKENAQAQNEEMQDKLVSAVLTGVNRAYPFTSSNSERLSKHIETLFRITHSSNFNTSIQALMLIQQLTSTHQVSSDRFYRTLYESLLDPRVATSSKQSLYLNLLFKALKSDVSVRRIKAFVKRIVQVLGLHQPAFICGVFYLIRELEKTFVGLQALYDQPEDNDDDEEEVFKDVPDKDDVQEQEVSEEKSKPLNGYDPRKRDPEHSNADKACLWEMLPYLSHFHPSVSVNAMHLLENQPMSGKPDLTIHTLTHFLDRFVYRTPKAAASTRGSSLMQPLAGSDAKDRLVTAGKHAQNLPLNSEAFWKKKAEDVSAEDAFFHEYFSRLGKDKERAAQKKKKSKDPVERDEEGDVDEEGRDEDDELSEPESEIWKALVDSRPELDGAEDSDDDLDLDDLESAYDQSDEGDDDEVIFNDESDEDEEMEDAEEEEKPAKPVKSKKKSKDEDEDLDDEEAFDMDVSDEEAFVDSDEDLPSDVDLGGVELPKDDDKKSKKRKLKHLPTFASADDYAALLAGDDEGM